MSCVILNYKQDSFSFISLVSLDGRCKLFLTLPMWGRVYVVQFLSRRDEFLDGAEQTKKTKLCKARNPCKFQTKQISTTPTAESICISILLLSSWILVWRSECQGRNETSFRIQSDWVRQQVLGSFPYSGNRSVQSVAMDRAIKSEGEGFNS
jgi:hypothetical protein